MFKRGKTIITLPRHCQLGKDIWNPELYETSLPPQLSVNLAYDYTQHKPHTPVLSARFILFGLSP